LVVCLFLGTVPARDVFRARAGHDIVKKVVWIAALALAAGFGYVIIHRAEAPSERVETGPAQSPGFRDAGAEAGINFRMQFLPNEQGTNFKINLYDHGCGVVVGDYDGDGHEDIYFLNQLGPNALYRNKGDGTFEDVTGVAGVALGDRICVAGTFGDYDNDGHADLYVTSTRGGNVLFRNLGNGKFKDVTKEAGLTCVAHSQTAAFFDYNNDGFLDLFVTNTAKWTLEYDKEARYFPGLEDLWAMAGSPREYNILYRNNGDGTFTDVTEQAGLKGKGWGGDVAVFDYDGDGHLDLLVTNMFGASQLYRNNGNGTFTEVTKRVLGRTSWGAIGCKAFDFNNDGLLDVFIVDMHSDMWLPSKIDPAAGSAQPPYDLTKKYRYVLGPFAEGNLAEELRFQRAFDIDYAAVLFGNTFFKHDSPGKFEEISARANLETFWPWGIATGDFDNDGYEDIFLPSGMGYPYGYWPNALLMNNGNETFSERAAAAGLEPPPGGRYLPQNIGKLSSRSSRSSRCAAVADFNHDGRLDLIVNNFNDKPYYFRNQFPQKNYVAFRLRGTKSNRDAIGALVKLELGTEVMVRQVHAAGGYLSQSSRNVHFGLGDRARIDRATIRWPSGTVQTLDNPPINTLHSVTEPVAAAKGKKGAVGSAP
jgi:hypothetical protein